MDSQFDKVNWFLENTSVFVTFALIKGWKYLKWTHDQYRVQ